MGNPNPFSRPTQTNPTPSKPTFGTQMGKGSPNANIDRKGTFKGVEKTHQKKIQTLKSAPMAKSNAFGQAKTIASGKKNFSRGAPGHEAGK